VTSIGVPNVMGMSSVMLVAPPVRRPVARSPVVAKPAPASPVPTFAKTSEPKASVATNA
jgi:hypothetical protein